MPEHVRAYLYRVAVGLVPLLIGFGVVSETDAALWLGLVAAILSFGQGALNVRYTSTERPDAGE